MATEYYKRSEEELTRDELIQDNDFLNDAVSFLEKRTGETEFESEQEIYDEFMRHMRFHETNEVTAVRDLMYAQEADEEGKAQFGRLLRTWDRMEGDPDLFNKAVDYVQAGLSSPSTWIGLVTGGVGKASTVAATQAAKTGARVLLADAMKGAGKAAVAEGAIGLGTGAAQESARVEAGAQEEFTGERTLLTGAGQALAGAIPGSISGVQQGIAERAAGKLRAAGEEAMSKAAQEAKENVDKTLSAVKDKSTVIKTKDQILTSEVKKARDYLKEAEASGGTGKQPLDKEKVREGTALLQSLSNTERMIASLDDETLDALTAAAIRLGDEIGVQKNERITSAVSRAIEDGRLELGQLDTVLRDFNLTRDQFSYMYMAELSRAGRTLAQASKIARETGMTAAQKKQKQAREKALERKLDRLSQAASDYMNQTGSGITKAEAKAIAEEAGKQSQVRNALQDVDRFRLSMMTGQLATTVRNVAGGGFRVIVDAFNRQSENILHQFAGVKQYEDPTAVTRYLLFNQAEAKVVREMFQKTMPNEANKFFSTFFETATTSAKLGNESFLTQTGAVVNKLNRMSDNMYKQAIFAGRLDQLVRRDMDSTLADVIANGQFAQLDKGMIKDAIEESLTFVYQKTPTGEDVFSKAGRTLIDAHRNFPFVVSAFMPFPRFVINQLAFVSEHMPAVGLLASKMQKKEAMRPELLAKQITGTAMLATAYNLRESQGPETEWYEYETQDGKTIDLRPIAGPFNAFLLGADAIYRVKNGLEVKSAVGQFKDAFQALGGPSFRAGTGLYTLDRLVEDLSGEGDIGLKAQDAIATTVGDIVNTFTLPLATARDLVSLTDEEQRLVPETGYVDMFDIFAARATRSLPEIPGLSLSETISDVAGSGEVEVGTPRPDIITGEPLRSVDPFERQIFGTGKRAPKNALQRTLVRLQMSPYELYRPSQYPFEDRLLREAAGSRVAERLNSFVQSEEFQNMGPKLQKIAIAKRAKDVISQVREGVRERIDAEQKRAAEAGESTERDQFTFESLPNRMRSALREAYEEQYGKDMGDDYRGALELKSAVESRAKGFAKGGLVSFLDDPFGDFGGATAKQTDELLDDADVVDASDYGDELLDDMPDDIPDDEFLEELYRTETGDASSDDVFFSPQTKETLEAVGDVALEVLIGSIPVVGDVYDAQNVAMALNDRRYVDAAIDAVGFVPVLGNVMKAGIKGTVDLFKSADPVVKRRTLGEFVREEGRLPELADQDDIDTLTNIGATQEKILAGAARRADERDMPLFHGTREGVEELSDENMRMHSELGRPGLSTSRDPLTSAAYFQSGPIEEMFVVRPKRGLMAREDMRPSEYDALRRETTESVSLGTEIGPIESGLPVRLPKSMHVEAETMIQDIAGDVDVSQLRDNPELLKRVQRGLDELDETLDELGSLQENPLADKEDAMMFYSTLRNGMKKAQGLGAYTSGAGARGVYDKILSNMALDVDDGGRLGSLMLREKIDRAAEMLKGTQRGEQLAGLSDSLEDVYDAQFMASARDSAERYTTAKNRVMDITQKMNRGGLASKR